MEEHHAATEYWDQTGFDARFEWGEEGVRRLAPGADIVVIVDVLSFSTCVDVAVGRGARVLPYRWRDDGAEAFAAQHGARLAVTRRRVSADHPFTLSPPTLSALQPGEAVVLPSPNGATLTVLAAESRTTVIAGCLRNALAVGRAARSYGSALAVIAAGERWPGTDGLLRPAVEDLVGAGAILHGWELAAPAPEAAIAIAAYKAVAHDIPGFLRACSSGRERIESGYADDVAYAVQLDVSQTIPILRDRAYVAL